MGSVDDLAVPMDDVDAVEDYLRNEEHATYTAGRMRGLMGADGLRVTDCVEGLRDLLAGWSDEASATFLHGVCSADVDARAREVCLVGRGWHAHRLGRVVHHLSCFVGNGGSDEPSVRAAGAYAATVWREHSLEYACEWALAFLEPCAAEHTERTVYWTDFRLARILAHATTATTAPYPLPESSQGGLDSWRLDPYVFGVMQRLQQRWTPGRLMTFLGMLLDRLVNWYVLAHSYQTPGLLTPGWLLRYRRRVCCAGKERSHRRAWPS